MSRPRLILCNGAELPKSDTLRGERHTVTFSTQGRRANVHLRIEDIVHKFQEQLTPRLEDLLEIATYVYVADIATKRSGQWAADESLEPWERDHRFVIGVRDPAFWSQSHVKDLLAETLQHLADDAYDFHFQPLKQSKSQKQSYFQVGSDADWPFRDCDRVVMFSGGLDSLAGIAEAASHGENLVLVSHRPVAIQNSRQVALVAHLRQTFPQVKLLHVPVWINKDDSLSKEFTQRTRSFLYSALGAIVAASVNAKGVRFFENGIVSLNFPVSGDPKALHDFQRLYSLVLGRDMVVDNPFIFLTKQDVVELIATTGHPSLISSTCSCAHQGHFQSKSRWHCGTCSQCIDRRFAILAAGLENHDAAADYKTDVFTGERKEGYEQRMGIDYVRHGVELSQLSSEEIATQFHALISRAFRYCPDPKNAPEKLVEMHRRHGNAVKTVLSKALGDHAAAIVDGTANTKCLLSLVATRQHLIASWRHFAVLVKHVLRRGLPPLCQKALPENELRLQELCDGLLKAAAVELVREYPYMKWGSNLTKPDWSKEELLLWIEAKYVRKRDGLGKISEAIAADITKYGDSQRRVLFFVFDPEHVIVDEPSFIKPILDRDGMDVFIVR